MLKGEEQMNNWFVVSAVLASAICLLHISAGGKSAARPLLASEDLKVLPKYTNYYCWHLVTLMLAGLAVSYAFAAIGWGGRSLALAATVHAAVFAAWSVLMIWYFRLSPWLFPQWALFLPLAALGAAGLTFQ
jgi:hypothetical protein